MSCERTEVNPAIQWWVGLNLPSEHIFMDRTKLPDDPCSIARLYFRKWVVHPIRRHLTHLYSEYLSDHGCELIGITGSAGKTTAKEMISSVLSMKFRTKWSPGNIDPVYNIPTTVLKTPLDTEKLVLEMGIEFPGEMDYYLWLVQPRTGIVTTVYWTHTQYLGSLDNVLSEKGRLIESLPSDGFAILNYDDPLVRRLADRTKASVIWYGLSKQSDVAASDVRITDQLKTSFRLDYNGESVSVDLPFLGRHFVPLALLAASVGFINGLGLDDVKIGLEKVEPQAHRMIPLRKSDGTIIIDDTYNANPLAAREAAKVLKEVGGKNGRTIYVLGEMKELGQYEEDGHREVGRVVSDLGIDLLFTLGELTRSTVEEAINGGMSEDRARNFTDKGKLIKELVKFVKKGDTVLVKGSRSMVMEEIVDALL